KRFLKIRFRSVTALEKLQHHRGIVDGLFNGLIIVGPGFFRLYRGQYFFCRFRVVPKIGLQGKFLFGVQLFLFDIDVKDASLGKLIDPSSLAIVPWS
ncbi:MAG: hypothetical protein INR69_16940, partial [Mucilaginibacter polytrichastri]|nr:hypothetical protein [Mucilaginibacter polytrichastri]